MKKVTLEWHEAAMAAEIGRMRQLAALKSGLADANGCEGPGWSYHIEGACGELATAKATGRYWDGAVNSFKREDLPGRVQVRTRLLHHYDLIVRKDDRDDENFVLVTGSCPHFIVHGWIPGAEAKKPEFLAEHGGRPPAFFVPQSALRPIDGLPA